MNQKMFLSHQMAPSLLASMPLVKMYVFAIWFTQLPQSSPNSNVVWVGNRDQPVNGKRSSLSLLRSGNLILSDAGQRNVWSSDTSSSWPTRLTLNDNGNLVLYEIRSQESNVIWQSFDFPTDTLLPGQQLMNDTQLVASRSDTNLSSGFYKLFFDDNNVLRLLYHRFDVSSVYWPAPWMLSFEAGRSANNSSRVAVLDSLGSFISTDNYRFTTSDYEVSTQRKLKIDPDGNLRVYSLQQNDQWFVSWQAIADSCHVHGICGVNSMCKYDHSINKRKCSCLPGYRVKNHSDWSYGCEPKFEFLCGQNFLKLPSVEFYGNDHVYKLNISFKNCKDLCIQDCECKVFQHTFGEDIGLFRCYIKRTLVSGINSPIFRGTTYLRLPKSSTPSFLEEEESSLDSGDVCFVKLERASEHDNSFVKFLLWFSIAVGVLEVLCICLIWCSLIRPTKDSDANQQVYNFLSPFRFRKFTYPELKQATKGFREEIGRGAGGIVYKGVLSDQRVAAIKKLTGNNVGGKQEEGEFMAEVSIIGRLNHMNLIEMWGYCAEGKHRLLVYEYMENGSLADNLKSNTLDWTKRYNIALGTARVLAYLHEECLEWILHCDIKPQNILLDSNYQPKVADFGLSKLRNRNDQNSQSFSMIRGTRGYMAPEWVFNLPITSKVDVYSYGIVVLEMMTGRSSMTMEVHSDDGEETQNVRLVTWVREKKKKTTSEEGSSSLCWVEQIIDPAIGSEYEAEKRKMETLASVALKCVMEDKEARPTMSQVVEMLQSHEDNAS
ncbi:putative receptor protein kinase ZmPK1 [Prosopis cineraria]|uniref:putative receptor protein kinase ZmPK1 n=1 Tax=Prosopis cineraria TaxID=364024 RepID=UPI0024101313|nr:putative receptor protein kinase ZmPK1 [Prosopis cineraria]